MRPFASLCVVVVLMAMLAAPSTHAQGGGASATGTIMGRVADTAGAALPGVTVTLNSLR